MKILAIETSCDETSAAVIENSQILSNVVSSQIFHEKFGGVVPELASRAHIQYISTITQQAIINANIDITDIYAIAVTAKPGLVGSLIVGSNYAKGLSLKYNLPIVPINHLEGHIFSACIENPDVQFPYIAAVFSGGHTSLFFVSSFTNYKIIGSTRDDAAGEAFDKIAKLMGLSYPGGPEINNLAGKGNSKKYNFPRSMINSGDYDFSFSGLKTSVRYFIQKEFKSGINNEELNDLAASVQSAIVEVLVRKSINAAIKHKTKWLAVAGGVSANSFLRSSLLNEGNKHNIKIAVPKLNYCMDNAAMIGFIAEKILSDADINNYFDYKWTVNSNAIRSKKIK